MLDIPVSQPRLYPLIEQSSQIFGFDAPEFRIPITEGVVSHAQDNPAWTRGVAFRDHRCHSLLVTDRRIVRANIGPVKKHVAFLVGLNSGQGLNTTLVRSLHRLEPLSGMLGQ